MFRKLALASLVGLATLVVGGGNQNSGAGAQGNDGNDTIDTGTDVAYGGNQNAGGGAGNDGNDTVDVADGAPGDTALGDNNGPGGEGSADTILNDAGDTPGLSNG